MTFKKNIVLEFTLVVILLCFAFLLREKPSTLEVVSVPPPIDADVTPEKKYNGSKVGSKSVQQTLRSAHESRGTNRAEILVKRNPFTPEGSFSDLTLPENPYTLVAIINEKQRRALLRLFTGEIQIVKEGDVLIDGARVLKIEERSITIERLRKRQELKLLHIEVEKWQTKK